MAQVGVPTGFDAQKTRFAGDKRRLVEERSGFAGV
jgi:hypothetical protein